MHHICYWNNEILKPIQKYGATNGGHGSGAFEKLSLLLARMMLRRTKVERADDMGLPCVLSSR
jgi:DNA repair protein RAD16